MDAGYGRDYRFLVMDNVNEQSSPAFDSAAVDSERSTRNPTIRFLGDLSWTRLHNSYTWSRSYSWSRWAHRSRKVFILNLNTKINSVLSAQWFVRLNHDRSRCQVSFASAKRALPRDKGSRRELKSRAEASYYYFIR